MKQIIKPITGYSVRKKDEKPKETVADVIQMHEKLDRPLELRGKTYKIKTPLSTSSLYVTINDIVLNEGTEHEHVRPFEIFINSKNMEQFQWILALTRVISAVFRKGGDISFLNDELASVTDPGGGYRKKGVWIPSLVAEIGIAIKEHLETIKAVKRLEKDDATTAYLDSKREEHVAVHGAKVNEGGYPAQSQLCKVCRHEAVINMDGCLTCLNCGDSKCM